MSVDVQRLALQLELAVLTFVTTQPSHKLRFSRSKFGDTQIVCLAPCVRSDLISCVTGWLVLMRAESVF